MRKFYQFVAFFILFSTLWSQDSSITLAQAGPASSILQQVNQFRIDNGLSPFQANSALVGAAQNQANYMANNMIFSSHVGDGGSTPQTRANSAGFVGSVTENIVGGTGMGAAQGLVWWINSPVHYRTLVTTRHTMAGTGYATNGSENFYVLVVGTPSNAPPPPATADDSPAPLFVTPIQLAVPSEDGSIVHIVEEGQALWSLAAHYTVSLSDILLFNGLTESTYVQPGDSIIIRLADGQPPPPTPAPPTTHIVQEGQSLWSIAAYYDVKFGDLLWFNGFTEDSILLPGDEVRIRLEEGESPPPTPTPVLYHTVSSGQTLWDIALTYGLSLDELLALNGSFTADSILQPGDQFLVRQVEPTLIPTVPPPETPQPVVLPTETAVSPIPSSPTPSTAVSSIAQSNNPTEPTPIPINANAQRSSSIFGLGTVLLAVGLLVAGGATFVFLSRQIDH
ncbi:MAG: LysM peptidoglycan-binding domain-containing protein [Chloroflexi bacterium]|nr:LysM peptidoglycan-binding domain-containing protein [Chloroflexota bacterium]